MHNAAFAEKTVQAAFPEEQDQVALLPTYTKSSFMAFQDAQLFICIRNSTATLSLLACSLCEVHVM
jgi:hypothetical protein